MLISHRYLGVCKLHEIALAISRYLIKFFDTFGTITDSVTTTYTQLSLLKGFRMQGLIIGISRKRNCIIRVSFISIDINSECHSFLAKTILDIHLHLEMTEVLIHYCNGMLFIETYNCAISYNKMYLNIFKCISIIISWIPYLKIN